MPSTSGDPVGRAARQRSRKSSAKKPTAPMRPMTPASPSTIGQKVSVTAIGRRSRRPKTR